MREGRGGARKGWKQGGAGEGAAPSVTRRGKFRYILILATFAILWTKMQTWRKLQLETGGGGTCGSRRTRRGQASGCPSPRRRVNMEQMRQSRPDSGLGFR